MAVRGLAAIIRPVLEKDVRTLPSVLSKAGPKVQACQAPFSTACSTEEGKISAYNSPDYQPSDSNTVEEKTGSERKLRAYGNIGTTTNAQMMLAEKEVVEEVNPYRIIANMFADAFCVKVY